MRYDPYKNLALAVIELAVKDYRQSWRYDAGITGKLEGYEGGTGAWVRDWIRRWIGSQEFELYAGDTIARNALITVLNKEDDKWNHLCV